MARLDWDRLRRTRPLDGTDVRVDPDGAHVWERPKDEPAVPFGARRLRTGIIVRRRQERAAVSEGREPPPPAAAPLRCQACGARVSPRKLLRHKRRCPAKPSSS